MPSLYQCPLMLHSNGLDDVVVDKLHLDVPAADLAEWKDVVARIASRSRTCTIALVGKYVKLHDAYLSVMESLYHAGFENDSQVEIKWVDSEELRSDADCAAAFCDVDGIIVPGGFGDRGIEGMVAAARWAREHEIPYFGICLGMQIMVIEFARGVLGYADANSSEFTPDGAHNVIALMADQQGNIPKGGTMRLGKYPCKVAPGTKMAQCYGQDLIWERHRHRYEFNNDFRAEMEAAGLVISGTSPDGRLVETVELPGRPFHLGAQFHPEFKSRPNRAHPLFKAFIAASLDNRKSAGRSSMDPYLARGQESEPLTPVCLFITPRLSRSGKAGLFCACPLFTFPARSLIIQVMAHGLHLEGGFPMDPTKRRSRILTVVLICLVACALFALCPSPFRRASLRPGGPGGPPSPSSPTGASLRQAPYQYSVIYCIFAD